MGLFDIKTPTKNCIRCYSPMEKAQLQEYEKLTIISQGVLFAKKSEVIPLVCPNCGYLEFSVNDPSIFKKK